MSRRGALKVGISTSSNLFEPCASLGIPGGMTYAQTARRRAAIFATAGMTDGCTIIDSLIGPGGKANAGKRFGSGVLRSGGLA
ncbi:hypothetical protein D3C78_1461340 [compost metagenome]